MVRLDNAGGTLLDLADALGAEVTFVVVTSLALGTLNHTELTVNALRARGFEPTGLVIGRRPPDPLGLAARSNLVDLPRLTGVPILATIPDGAATPRSDTYSARSDTYFARSDTYFGRSATTARSSRRS
jgi:dethiobiotin synthetase